MSISLPLGNNASLKLRQLFVEKQEKHNLIRVLVQTELDRISDALSRAIQNDNKSQAKSKSKSKAKVRKITVLLSISSHHPLLCSP